MEDTSQENYLSHASASFSLGIVDLIANKDAMGTSDNHPLIATSPSRKLKEDPLFYSHTSPIPLSCPSPIQNPLPIPNLAKIAFFSDWKWIK